MADAVLVRGRSQIRKTVTASVAVGKVHQHADGRATVYTGSNAAASGDRTGWTDEGQFTVTKTASQVWQDGQPIYWDRSANSATCITPIDDRDFYLGVAVGDAASADATGVVNLNVRGEYIIDLLMPGWTNDATNGLGTTLLMGGAIQVAFDAVAEAAQVADYSTRTFPVGSKWILEGRMAVVDKGDNAALDFDVGVANGTHATDFESIAEFVAFHFDGNAFDIKAHSDDGATDVAPTDTTIDASAGVYFDFVIDGRDHTSCKLYVNGVRALSGTTFTLTLAAGPLKAIALMEKTSDDTTADVRLERLRVRIAEQ